ncbi:MAG: hypothetical protein OQL27_05105 [Sedimenticola sp.]|nr:hypothetical protein [Sedimenticola sp.]
MISKKYVSKNVLPLYEVKELTMEEALLELAAEKELLLQKTHEAGYGAVDKRAWMASRNHGSVAA